MAILGRRSGWSHHVPGVQMTPTSREALRRAAEKASPGPWAYDETENYLVAGSAGGGARILDVQPRSIDTGVAVRNNNGDFIALCDPQTILGLLDEVERLEGTQCTPGCNEVCNECHREFIVAIPKRCVREYCPIRQAQEGT